MKTGLETAVFINATRCSSRCSIRHDVTSLAISLVGSVSLSSVAVDGNLCGNITLKPDTPIALFECVLNA